jgi:hypothetical protein
MHQFCAAPLKIRWNFLLLAALCSSLLAQTPARQTKPSLSFQYSSWGMVRLELRDAIEGQDDLTCEYAEQGGQSKAVILTSTESTELKALLRSLKNESYSLSLPARGVVVLSDGESIEIEINAVSLGLHYRDAYESAKSHKPIRLLVHWAKRKFPLITTPKP